MTAHADGGLIVEPFNLLEEAGRFDDEPAEAVVCVLAVFLLLLQLREIGCVALAAAAVIIIIGAVGLMATAAVACAATLGLELVGSTLQSRF